jgi:hypothetical protein
LGVRGRPPQPYTARLRAATTVAPTWYAAAVLALGAFAATTLVGAPAGAGVAALGVALCALAAAHTATAGTATAADTATAMDSATAPSRGAATSGGLRGGPLAARGAVATGRVVVPHRTALWLLAASLAVMPAVRAAAWVWVPCLFGAVMLASLAAAGGRSGRQVVAGLTAAVRRPLLGTAAAVAPLGRAAGRADGARVRPALRGGLIAAALLAVFVPLFTAADAAFAELVDRALPSEIDVDAPIGRAFALAAVVALGGALALARARGAAAAGAPAAARLARTEWLLPLASLVALFAAFVAVQLAVLFGGHDHVLHTTGLSYADYAHQGYGQLMAAAMLTLAVIAGARRWTTSSCARCWRRCARFASWCSRQHSSGSASTRRPTAQRACGCSPTRTSGGSARCSGSCWSRSPSGGPAGCRARSCSCPRSAPSPSQSPTRTAGSPRRTSTATSTAVGSTATTSRA